MPRTRFPSQVVARIWDWLRKTFVIDWSRVRSKRDVSSLIRRRKDFLRSVISYKRSIRGISPREAQGELKRIEAGESNLRTGKVSTTYRRGWYQIKPLTIETMFVKSYSRKGIVVRGYTRSHLSWTSQQKGFVRERIGMRTSDLRNSFSVRFGVYRSSESIETMKYRIKSGDVKV